MIELHEDELYIFEGKILRLKKLAFSKSNNQQGLRPILKQLDKTELTKLLLEQDENQNNK